jgi:hypothetical protein
MAARIHTTLPYNHTGPEALYQVRGVWGIPGRPRSAFLVWSSSPEAAAAYFQERNPRLEVEGVEVHPGN